MSKFKLGERVKVYGNFKWAGSHMTYLRGTICTVTDTVIHDNDDNGEIQVSHPVWGKEIVHPKQCRKVKQPGAKSTVIATIEIVRTEDHKLALQLKK